MNGFRSGEFQLPKATALSYSERELFLETKSSLATKAWEKRIIFSRMTRCLLSPLGTKGCLAELEGKTKLTMKATNSAASHALSRVEGKLSAGCYRGTSGMTTPTRR